MGLMKDHRGRILQFSPYQRCSGQAEIKEKCITIQGGAKDTGFLWGPAAKNIYPQIAILDINLQITDGNLAILKQCFLLRFLSLGQFYKVGGVLSPK